MAARVAEERAIERAGRAGRGGGGRARLRSALAGGAAMLAGRCVSGSGAGARCGPWAARAGRELPCRELPAGVDGGWPSAEGVGGPVPPERSASGSLSLLGVGPPGSAGAAETVRQPVRSPGRGRGGVGGTRTQVVPFLLSEGRTGHVPAPRWEPVPVDLSSKISITNAGCLSSCLRACLWVSASPHTGLRHLSGSGLRSRRL